MPTVKTKPRSSAGRGRAPRLDYGHRGASIGLRAQDAGSLAAMVEAGFPSRMLARFQEATGFPLETISDLLQIPVRTLSRRKTQRRLRPDESDRLLRAAILFERAVALFEGDRAGAAQWLQAPQPALGDRTPLALARTEIGAREVEDLIGRLEHGSFT